MTSWTLNDLPRLDGKGYVVTGATSGLGQVTAHRLAAAGADVVLACRDLDKGAQVRTHLERCTPGVAARLEVRRLDLADLDSVRAFVQELGDRRIDGLVNNAGIYADSLARTVQGHEAAFGTNVLGPFLLTRLLLDRELITDRVVWLSSSAHLRGAPDLTDLDWRRREYSGWQSYADSKLADLLLAYELQRHFVREGSPLRSMAAHPGFSATKLFDRLPSAHVRRVLGVVVRMPLLGQDAERGASTTLFAATLPDLAGGSYIGPSGPGGLQGTPRPVGSSSRSHDRELAAGLWAACTELTAS